MAAQRAEVCSQANAHNFVYCETENLSDSLETSHVFTRDLNCTLINCLRFIALEIRILLKGQAIHDVQSCHTHALHSRQIGNTITYCTSLPVLCTSTQTSLEIKKAVDCLKSLDSLAS